MISAPTDFVNALENGDRNYQLLIHAELVSGTTLTLTNAEIWSMGLSIEDSISTNADALEFGTAVIGQLMLTLNNIHDDFTQYDFTNADITVQLGLRTDESLPYSYMQRGVYRVIEMKGEGGLISLTCQDAMYHFDQTYPAIGIVFPSTALAVVQDACNSCGVTLGVSTFTGASTVIPAPPAEGVTYRAMLSWVGQMVGCSWKINADGELMPVWYDLDALADWYSSGTVPYEISQTAAATVALDDTYVTGIQIVVANEPSEDPDVQVDAFSVYTAGTDGYMIKIEGNPLITNDNAQAIANTLYSQVSGMRFRKATITYMSDPRLESGDVAVLHDYKSNDYAILISTVQFVVGEYQASVSASETPARNSAERYGVGTQNTVRLFQAIQREMTAREDAIADLQEQLDEAPGLYMTTTTESGATVYILHNQPNLADSDVVWKMTSTAFGVSTNGGQTWNAGLTADGTVIAQRLYSETIVAGILQSDNYEYTSGVYSDAGMIVDLDNKVIRTPSFAVTPSGVLYAKDAVISGTITLGGANNVNGTLTILDASGQSIGSWNNNGILLTAGSKFNMVAPDGRNVMNIGVINNSSGYASVSLDVANPNGQTVFKTNLHGLVIPYQVTSCVYDDDRSDVGIPITIQQQSDGEYAFVFQSAPLRAFHLIYSTNSLLMRTKIGTKVTEGTQGISSILIGTENDTYYQYSIAIGNLISNTHTEAFAIGLGLETTGDYQTILGRFNDTDEDGIFAIGSGTGENNRQNIFSIDRAGYIHFVGGMMTNTAVNIYTNCADPSDTKRFLFATDGGFVAPGIIIAHDNVYATDDTRYISLKIDSDGQKAGLWDANYGNYMMYGSTGNTWLYLNKGDIYSSGIYCGTKILRTDGKVRVGTGNVPFTDIYPNYTVVCAPSTSLAWVECRSGTNNSIFIQSRTGGEVELSSKGENGTTYPILRRANNSGAITAKEYWTFEHSPELPNGVYIYSRFTANNGNGILAGTNSSNHMFFGYGSYASNIGETYLDGNKVTLRSKNGIEIMPNANTSINKFNIMDSGNVYCGTTSDTVNHFICVRTKNKSGSMQANTAGTFGLWCDTNSKWLIYINSSGTVIANTSDIRYKENVSDMSYDDALSILREVDVINFSYKDDESKQMQSGVSAQQLRDVVLAHDIKEHAYLAMTSTIDGSSDVYTDISMPDKDIRYEVDYTKLIPILWKGWQYQDERIKELEAEIERMKKAS